MKIRITIWAGFLLGIMAWLPAKAQPGPAPSDSAIYAPITTASARTKLYQELVQWDIEANLDYDLNPDNEENWENAFWPMELIRYHSPDAAAKFREALAHIGLRSELFQRGMLEVIYANYPHQFSSSLEGLMTRTTSAEIYALCAEYLYREGTRSRQDLLKTMMQKIPADSIQSNPILHMLRLRLSSLPGISQKPHLASWLNPDFAPGCTVLLSFQRDDRKYPGLALVRKPDGSLVRDSSGRVFSVPQMALSVSDLPFYLVNGNTPQGIYRMNGFARSSSEFIGPTENIQLSLPFEIPADSFFATHDPSDTLWSLSRYRNILPTGWRDDVSVLEAYYAGKAGRTAIIAHGTTIDPSYYKGEIYYPQTPSLGCLCAHESWSPADGSRMESDQQKLVDAIRSSGDGTGYAVVINLDNLPRAVSLQEVLTELGVDTTGAP